MKTFGLFKIKFSELLELIKLINNLNYLKLCLISIKKNSLYDHEIIIHINEGSDGTIDFIKSNEVIHTSSYQNIGLCSGVNLAAKKATNDYILYSHDDMYFCPGWDECLKQEILKINNNFFYLSATMIERNSGHLQLDCGENYKDFDEKKLLNNLKNIMFTGLQYNYF